MHTRRTTTVAALSALLALGGTAAVATAQDDESLDDATTAQTLSGTIETSVNEAGQTIYQLRVGEELFELSFGPAWFTDLGAMFGLENPLEDGAAVELGGNVRSMSPNENASVVAQEKAAQTLKVKTLDGEPRDKGKPAWAGGPKEQLEAHPGYEGWSKGQANKEAAKAAKTERAAARAQAKEEKAAVKAQAKAEKAAAKANKPGKGPRNPRQDD